MQQPTMTVPTAGIPLAVQHALGNTRAYIEKQCLTIAGDAERETFFHCLAQWFAGYGELSQEKAEGAGGGSTGGLGRTAA
jgi:hypothetical protein